MKFVCESEGVKAESDALYELARQADGALRDGLSLLEQVIASGDVTLANVEAVCGAGSRPAFERWLRALHTNPEEAYSAIKAMFDAGASGVRVFEEMFSLVRNVWLASKWKGITETLGLSSSEKRFIAEEVNSWKPDRLHVLLNNILRGLTQARLGTRPDILLGMFTLSLEAEPTQTSAIIPQTPATPVQQAAVPVNPPVSVKAEPAKPVVYDEALKAELLTVAHDADFVIYCALFGVKTGKIDGTLVIDAEHPYSFDRLKVDENSSKLAEMFSNYGKVTLRFKDEEKICEVIPRVELPSSQTRDTAPAPKPAPVELPAFEPEPAELPEPPEPQKNVTRTVSKYTPSAFEKYRLALAHLGVNPEIVLSQRIEAEDDASDEDLQQEGDNDE